MRKSFFSLLLLAALKLPAQTPKVTAGKIDHIENFPSKFVAARNVDVWLPDGYSPAKKYAVLYMHDGMALFDAAIMWNKQDWGADAVAGKLMKEGRVKDFIIVGIWNGGPLRHSEYFPQKPFESLPQQLRDSLYTIASGNGRLFAAKVQSDNYLKFLVGELKPYIDRNYSVFKDQKNTFIAGSSMGGLISLYGICEYPKVFGGAACLSTHWPGIFNANEYIPAAFITYMKQHLPSPGNHKIYFDYGDKTLDAMYAPYQQQADAAMQVKGYTTANWETKFFPGADHSENSWKVRLDMPMVFLLGK